MTFLRPDLLPLVALAGIPALFHLFFRIRRRRLKLPTLRFLHQQQREESSQRLREFLLLLIRTLVLLLAALAFARPAPSGQAARQEAGRRHQVILLDRSLSMEVMAGGRPRLAQARELAEGAVRSAPDGARFTLIAVDDQAEVIGADEADRGKVISWIRGLESRGRGTDLAAGLAAARNELLQRHGGRLAVVTDWQTSGAGGVTPALLADLSVEAVFFPELTEATPPNLGIGRLLPLWGVEPKVRIPSAGAPGEPTLKREVVLTGTRAGRGTDPRLPRAVFPPAGQALELPLPPELVTGETVEVTARLEPQDALAADDLRRVVFQTPRPVAVSAALDATAAPYLAAGLTALAYAYPQREDGKILVGVGGPGGLRLREKGAALAAAVLFVDELDPELRGYLGLRVEGTGKESSAAGQAWRIQENPATPSLATVTGVKGARITARLRLDPAAGEVLLRYNDNLPAALALPATATRPPVIIVTTVPRPADGDLALAPAFPILLANLLRRLTPGAQGKVIEESPRAPDEESDLRALDLAEARTRLGLADDAVRAVEAGTAAENDDDPARWWRYALGVVLALALLELLVGRKRSEKALPRPGGGE